MKKSKLITIILALCLALALAACSGGSGGSGSGTGGGSAPAITDAEVEALYEEAVKAYNWFNLAAMPIDGSVSAELDGMTYNKVDYPGISTHADLEAYLGTLFTADIVGDLLGENETYVDIGGELYAIDGARGANIMMGDETHEVIREGDDEILFRVFVNVFDGPFMDEESKIEGVEVYDFTLVPVGGNWLFSVFHQIR
ncbi:MAG: hypothetical protein FWH32_07875 [Clostridiales bacterium]|nr:hypothetical protein [Clostridiales bacterium]